MSECSEELRAADKPYPRTCAICGIGSCIKRHAPAVQPTELETLRAENARLQSIVDKLPKTADGVPIVGGPLYDADRKRMVQATLDVHCYDGGCAWAEDGEWHTDGSDLYSTEQAALAATKGEK